MPYIPKKDRLKFDGLIRDVAILVLASEEEVQDGQVNYIISTLLRRIYPLRYRHINRAMGVLECVKHEHYRRVASPYEDEAIERNGDIRHASRR